MKIIALLPIKEHSERVPGKNFRMLGNKPLYHWILDTLQSVSEIDEIIINTDADSPFCRTVRKRKPELCGDDVDMNRIIADDVAATNADIYIQTHATNPFLSADTIRKALEYRDEFNYGSVYGVGAIRARCNFKGVPVNHSPNGLIPTQELVPVWFDNSTFYIFTRESFLEHGRRVTPYSVPFETPPLESIDIDTEDDWKLAEKLAR